MAPDQPESKKLKLRKSEASKISDKPEENPDGLSQATEDFDESPDKARVETGEPLS